MKMKGPLKTFVAVLWMAVVIVCGSARKTFAQQPAVATVVPSLPRDASGAVSDFDTARRPNPGD
jgi:hypothetical protein